jgi:hypothetical protein
MTRLPPQSYAQWRVHYLSPPSLRETTEPEVPAERLLHAIWHHQRLLRDQLHTLDGQALQVLHPGFPNPEGGPDFRGAVLQFAGESPQVGDVEIDLQAANWRSHRHHQNPAYQNVLLHVVWEGSSSSAPWMPTLALKPVIDTPLPDLALWLGTDAARNWPIELTGQCWAELSRMEPSLLDDLLHQAARIRLQAKAAQLQARARQAGWDQALWEGLFRALGYKHNLWPMQRVAEMLPRLRAGAADQSASVLAWQARLMGASGLLPAEPPAHRRDASHYLGRLWDHWWREWDAMIDFILPRTLWRFHGLRPANHPLRRLALAAHWLASGDLLGRLEHWFTTPAPEASMANSLLAVLQVDHDDFWSKHWTFVSPPMPRPQPLLGAMRVTDLAVNVVLPWFWIRAMTSKNEVLQGLAEQRYFAWPKGEDNAILRLARQRLLGGAPARRLSTAVHQQGLLQIVRDFCDHSNAVCVDCWFPEMLRSVQV